MSEITILTAKTHLGGSGTPNRELFAAALAHKPVFVGIQGASADHGPYYLGAGVSRPARAKIKSELEVYVPACLERGVRFAVGGSPTGGTSANVDNVLQILREVAAEQDLSFRLAVIYSDIPKDYLHERLATERIDHLEFPDRPLTHEMVDSSTNIVAYMGWDPFVAALD